MFGLSNNEISQIQRVFNAYHDVDKVVVYGSRAKGNYTSRSDVDLAVFGKFANRHRVAEMKMDLDSLDIKYLIELQQYDYIVNQDLRNHIQRVGVVIYEKEENGKQHLTVS